MLNPWALFGGVLLLIATAFGGAHVGKKLEREAWQAERINLLVEQGKALAAASHKYAADAAAQEAQARTASKGYQTKLEALDEKYRAAVADLNRRGGLRINVPVPHCPGPAPATEGAGAGRPDAAVTESIRLPEPVERDLLTLAHDADKVVAQCQALQDWVRTTGHYGSQE